MILEKVDGKQFFSSQSYIGLGDQRIIPTEYSSYKVSFKTTNATLNLANSISGSLKDNTGNYVSVDYFDGLVLISKPAVLKTFDNEGLPLKSYCVTRLPLNFPSGMFQTFTLGTVNLETKVRIGHISWLEYADDGSQFKFEMK